MELKGPILKILNKKYDCLAVFECSCKRYQLSFKTDRFGDPIDAFLGKRTAKGNLKGIGYIRQIIRDYRGNPTADRWIQGNEYNRL